MNTFNFGDPNLFAQGIVEQTLYDPNTGDIVGFDNVGSDVAINYTFDFSELTGGFNNQLVGLIPHSTRLTGTYTSQAFSLKARQLLTGGSLDYNGIAPVCETITATTTTLTVTRTPAKSYAQASDDVYGWCHVRVHGATEYKGTNYGVDLTSKEVQEFTAVAGTQYDVFYFTPWTSSQVLAVPASANPSIVTVQQKWGIYAKQNNSITEGTLQGYLYVVVPNAMLMGDAGLDGNQTTNVKTNYNWQAITPDNNVPVCDACSNESTNLCYYIYVPCGEATQAVSALAIVGGEITVGVGETVQIPVKYIMPDNSLAQPVYTDLTYESANIGTATVSTNGQVTGVEAGTTSVTVSLNNLTAIANITVA